MIAEMEYAESFDEYMERALNKAKKEGRKEAVEEAVKKAEPLIAKEAAAKKLDMTLAQFETLFC
ncbi:hypothetical protein [Succinimonas sp.]|uniref:hypothetical protein n=1 Tax=Succinimonas sp. TaxID=1936151 RepID=UPI0038688956